MLTQSMPGNTVAKQPIALGKPVVQLHSQWLQKVKEAQLASKALTCCIPAPPTVTNESLCCVSRCILWLVHHLLTVPQVLNYGLTLYLKSHWSMCSGHYTSCHLRRSPGGWLGNPLQFSCLENPMDRRAWWAAVYGVAQSRAQLKRLSNSSTWKLFN